MEDGHRAPLVKVIAQYSSSNMYRQLLRVLNAFIKPKLLNPEMYGLWNLLSLINTYSLSNDLGSRLSMKFSVPYHEGQKDFQKSNEIRSSVFYGTLYINIFMAAALLIYALIRQADSAVRFGLITISGLMLLCWYGEYYDALLRARHKFELITTKNYLEATVAFVFNAILIYLFGIYGVYISAILSSVLILLYLHARHPIGRLGRFQTRIFLETVKSGFPIMLFSLSIALMRSFDRVLIASFLDIKLLGYYGIAGSVFDFCMQIPGASREIIEPRLMQDLNRNSIQVNLREYFLKPLVNMAYFLPLLIGAVFFITPVFITLLLPKYIPGILPAQIIIFGGYFLSLSFVTRSIIVAHGWQLKSVSVLAIALFVNVAASISLLKLGYGISAVATSSSVSYLILFVGLMLFLRRRCDFAPGDWKVALSSLYWPFPLMCITIFLVQYISGFLFTNDILAAFFKLSVFSVVMLLAIRRLSRKNAFLKGTKLMEMI